MKLTIKSLNDQMIQADNYGIIEFPEISMNSDYNTEFEFDDNDKNIVTFNYKDGAGFIHPKRVDLSEFELEADYILNKIKPVFDKEQE